MQEVRCLVTRCLISREVSVHSMHRSGSQIAKCTDRRGMCAYPKPNGISGFQAILCLKGIVASFKCILFIRSSAQILPPPHQSADSDDSRRRYPSFVTLPHGDVVSLGDWLFYLSVYPEFQVFCLGSKGHTGGYSQSNQPVYWDKVLCSRKAPIPRHSPSGTIHFPSF